MASTVISLSLHPDDVRRLSRKHWHSPLQDYIRRCIDADLECEGEELLKPVKRGGGQAAKEAKEKQKTCIHKWQAKENDTETQSCIDRGEDFQFYSCVLCGQVAINRVK